MIANNSRTKDAPHNAPSPVMNISAELARDLFADILAGVRPPTGQTVVPEITVSLSYRFESDKNG